MPFDAIIPLEPFVALVVVDQKGVYLALKLTRPLNRAEKVEGYRAMGDHVLKAAARIDAASDLHHARVFCEYEVDIHTHAARVRLMSAASSSGLARPSDTSRSQNFAGIRSRCFQERTV